MGHDDRLLPAANKIWCLDKSEPDVGVLTYYIGAVTGAVHPPVDCVLAVREPIR